MMQPFVPQFNFNYKNLSVRIFELVREFEGKVPKIITLKLYVDGNYRTEKTFYNEKREYEKNYNKLLRYITGISLGKSRKKNGDTTTTF